jgi:DNA polymerase III epsilon subunit-like protein
MKYLFLDTETTGFSHFARIIQIAWLLYDGKELLREEEHLIKPDGWEIKKEKFWVDNGFSTEKSTQEGEPIKDVMIKLFECINESNLIVAHNIDFDFRMIKKEMGLLNLKFIKEPEIQCTMKLSKSVYKKNMTLVDLYAKLTGLVLKGHTALIDAKACGDCFFALKGIR